MICPSWLTCPFRNYMLPILKEDRDFLDCGHRTPHNLDTICKRKGESQYLFDACRTDCLEVEVEENTDLRELDSLSRGK